MKILIKFTQIFKIFVAKFRVSFHSGIQIGAELIYRKHGDEAKAAKIVVRDKNVPIWILVWVS